jgi:hypothetical protein
MAITKCCSSPYNGNVGTIQASSRPYSKDHGIITYFIFAYCSGFTNIPFFRSSYLGNENKNKNLSQA